MGLSKLVRTLAISVTLALSGCHTVKTTIYPNVGLRPKTELSNKCTPSKEAFETILTRIWNSGFLAQNEKVKEEINNNEYGTFEDGCGPRGCEDAIACFLNYDNRADVVYLNEGAFCIEYREEKTYYKTTSTFATYAPLVHDLFHDFWLNILDQEQRKEFSSEAKKFYNSMISAKTKEDKLLFLQDIGVKNPKEEDYEAFASLVNQKEKRRSFNKRKQFSDEEFFGFELYPILAEKAYNSDIIIPKQLRQFYQGMISEEALNRNEM